jgi:hypothetical protein
VLVAIPAIALSRLPNFQLVWIWYLSVVTILIQMTISLLLLRREYRRRLDFEVSRPPVGVGAPERAPAGT